MDNTKYMVDLIEKYCMVDSLECYDPYDIWKTSLGISVKRLFIRNRYLGLLPAAVLTLYDYYLNNGFRFFYEKQEYPIVRAQASLTLLNLYKSTGNQKHLSYAKKHIDWLLKNHSSGYSGLCWGTGFKIVVSDKLVYDENTPFTTNTPYALEALDEYYQLTKDPEVLKGIHKVFDFYEKDIPIMEENEEILVTAYGPFKDRVVINAVSYTMYAYSIFYRYFDESVYLANKISKMYQFIKNNQNEDGSWFYDFDANSFIDCFHSCFVLKNICKTNDNYELNNADAVIKKGYEFVKTSFYDEKRGLFKRFAIENKPSIVKFDLYDNGELLSLAKLLNDDVVAKNLEQMIEKSFASNHSFYSVIDILGLKRNKDTLRWAVMPYILAKSQKCTK